jgi:hypothetical protein
VQNTRMNQAAVQSNNCSLLRLAYSDAQWQRHVTGRGRQRRSTRSRRVDRGSGETPAGLRTARCGGYAEAALGSPRTNVCATVRVRGRTDHNVKRDDEILGVVVPRCFIMTSRRWSFRLRYRNSVCAAERRVRRFMTAVGTPLPTSAALCPCAGLPAERTEVAPGPRRPTTAADVPLDVDSVCRGSFDSASMVRRPATSRRGKVAEHSHDSESTGERWVRRFDDIVVRQSGTLTARRRSSQRSALPLRYRAFAALLCRPLRDADVQGDRRTSGFYAPQTQLRLRGAFTISVQQHIVMSSPPRRHRWGASHRS